MHPAKISNKNYLSSAISTRRFFNRQKKGFIFEFFLSWHPTFKENSNINSFFLWWKIASAAPVFIGNLCRVYIYSWFGGILYRKLCKIYLSITYPPLKVFVFGIRLSSIHKQVADSLNSITLTWLLTFIGLRKQVDGRLSRFWVLKNRKQNSRWGCKNVCPLKHLLLPKHSE